LNFSGLKKNKRGSRRSVKINNSYGIEWRVHLFLRTEKKKRNVSSNSISFQPRKKKKESRKGRADFPQEGRMVLSEKKNLPLGGEKRGGKPAARSRKKLDQFCLNGALNTSGE